VEGRVAMLLLYKDKLSKFVNLSKMVAGRVAMLVLSKYLITKTRGHSLNGKYTKEYTHTCGDNLLISSHQNGGGQRAED
jgi:hypothetical protein